MIERNKTSQVNSRSPSRRQSGRLIEVSRKLIEDPELSPTEKGEIKEFTKELEKVVEMLAEN